MKPSSDLIGIQNMSAGRQFKKFKVPGIPRPKFGKIQKTKKEKVSKPKEEKPNYPSTVID